MSRKSRAQADGISTQEPYELLTATDGTHCEQSDSKHSPRTMGICNNLGDSSIDGLSRPHHRRTRPAVDLRILNRSALDFYGTFLDDKRAQQPTSVTKGRL